MKAILSISKINSSRSPTFSRSKSKKIGVYYRIWSKLLAMTFNSLDNKNMAQIAQIMEAQEKSKCSSLLKIPTITTDKTLKNLRIL